MGDASCSRHTVFCLWVHGDEGLGAVNALYPALGRLDNHSDALRASFTENESRAGHDVLWSLLEAETHQRAVSAAQQLAVHQLNGGRLPQNRKMDDRFILPARDSETLPNMTQNKQPAKRVNTHLLADSCAVRKHADLGVEIPRASWIFCRRSKHHALAH